jgi:acetyl-CoA synthetase
MWDWDSEAKELGIDIHPTSLLNIGTQISDKICDKGFRNKIAVICQRKDGKDVSLSYGDLSNESSKVSEFLKSLGICKGDRVAVCVDKNPSLYMALLGILKAGAVIVPVFSSFGIDAMKDRLEDSEAAAIVIQCAYIDKITKFVGALPNLKNIIVIKDPNLDTAEKFIDFDDYKKYEGIPKFENTCAEDPAVIHYTSGTTGKPKGALHVHAALLAHFASTKYIFELNEKDIYLCTADTAWVTGMSYGVIGPFSNAVTQVAIEGNLRPQRIFDAIQKYKVTVLYTSPTLLRMMMREKEETIKAFDFSSLRLIASVGEALNPEIVKWAEIYLGLPVNDTWFQTETGSIMIANKSGQSAKFGSMGEEVTPVQTEILDEQYMPLGHNQIGLLALKPTWPSLFKMYWNHPETYRSKFENGWYLTGDRAKKDDDGYFWFYGREDDVMNTAGHLVSPFEVESILMTHSLVNEAAVVGIPDHLLGEKIKAFIVLKPHLEESGQIKIELRSLIRNRVSPFAVPQEIEIIDELPKTDSGKILRRLLRLKN